MVVADDDIPFDRSLDGQARRRPPKCRRWSAAHRQQRRALHLHGNLHLYRRPQDRDRYRPRPDRPAITTPSAGHRRCDCRAYPRHAHPSGPCTRRRRSQGGDRRPDPRLRRLPGAAPPPSLADDRRQPRPALHARRVLNGGEPVEGPDYRLDRRRDARPHVQSSGLRAAGGEAPCSRAITSWPGPPPSWRRPTARCAPTWPRSTNCRRARDATLLAGPWRPGHNPQRFVRALAHHRRQREHAILARLRAEDRDVEAIVRSIYEGLAPALKNAAALSRRGSSRGSDRRGLVRAMASLGQVRALYRALNSPHFSSFSSCRASAIISMFLASSPKSAGGDATSNATSTRDCPAIGLIRIATS